MIFLRRTLPLLLAILLGSILSWMSIYAFWFGVWIFHNVAAARACDAAGRVLLIPVRLVFTQLGGDQTAIFFDPISYSVTNGLILGVAASLILGRFRHRSRLAEPVSISKPVPESAGTPR